MYFCSLSHSFVASTVLILWFNCEFEILFAFDGWGVVSRVVLVNSILILDFEALLGVGSFDPVPLLSESNVFRKLLSNHSNRPRIHWAPDNGLMLYNLNYKSISFPKTYWSFNRIFNFKVHLIALPGTPMYDADAYAIDWWPGHPWDS